jgi:8-oxo-dGTP pyrophosphatase MutT (NUDIX family)
MRTIVNALFVRDGMVSCWLSGALIAAPIPACGAFPGGHVETLTEALVREVQEEVGVTPTIYSPFISIVDPNAPETDLATYHIYMVRRWVGGGPTLRGKEHTELR